MDETYHLYSSSRNSYYNEDQPGRCSGVWGHNAGQTEQAGSSHETGSQKEWLQASGLG